MIELLRPPVLAAIASAAPDIGFDPELNHRAAGAVHVLNRTLRPERNAA